METLQNGVVTQVLPCRCPPTSHRRGHRYTYILKEEHRFNAHICIGTHASFHTWFLVCVQRHVLALDFIQIL